jgi:replicative DNA helicase
MVVPVDSVARGGSDGDKEDKIARDAPEYTVNIMVEKHRSGPVGIVPLHFVAAQTRYSSVLTREG